MVENIQLYSLSLGGDDLRLGSIEFIAIDEIEANGALFGLAREGQQAAGLASRTQRRTVQVSRLDLCVMNPAFTRSVGGNLLFGGLPEPQRKRMQSQLKSLRDRHNLDANITAGLGSVFVAVADRFLKAEGRIALVLPKALLNGAAWEKTRQLLTDRYALKYVVVSHEVNRWNFSENTDLSEALVHCLSSIYTVRRLWVGRCRSSGRARLRFGYRNL